MVKTENNIDRSIYNINMKTENSATSNTRHRLVEATITLMRRSGLSGAGINEIVRESGAPKGSVYHFFPNGKQQIVEESLAAYTARVVAFIDASLSSKRRPGEKIKALFIAFAERIEQGEFLHSCPNGTVCLDLDAELEGLRLVVAGAFGHYMKAIAAHFPFQNRQRAESFAGLVLTAIEGAYIRGRAERSSKPFRDAGKWLAELAETESLH
jgi:TetR/AcrR family transcriptional regulator, lmrAB and yxaGH operons repressor